MALYRTKNKTVAIKIEPTPGTDAVPTVGADAVLSEEPAQAPEFKVLDTNEVGNSLDSRGPIVGGGFQRKTLTTLLKGPGTAGTAPETGPLFRGSAMSETLTAADVTGTAQAGTASTMQLAAAAVTSDDQFKGMIIETTGGTGGSPSQKRVINGSVAATDTVTVFPDWTVTPDATTTYAIRANALYLPVSVGVENFTAYLWENHKDGASNSWLTKIVGGAATFSLSLPVRQIGRISWDLRGILPANPANVAAPGAATYDATRPPPFKNARVHLGQNAVKFNSYSLEYGGNVQQPDDPGALHGMDIADVGDRKVTGSINPQKLLASTRDIFADFIAGTEQALWLDFGTVAGNRISILHPTIRFSGATPGDQDGFLIEEVPFEAVGFDNGVYACFY